MENQLGRPSKPRPDASKGPTLFDALLQPDYESEPLRALIAEAANLLEVGEYQLLQLAYRERFGRELTGRGGGRLFESFMVQGVVPSWATAYARRILQLEAAGQLDIRDPAFHVYDNNYVTYVPDGVRKFVWVVLTLTFLICGGLYVTVLSVEDVSSVLPPYFSESELQPRG